MKTGLNLNDPKVITKLNQVITEEFVQTIISEQLETLLNKIAAENGTITVQVRGGFITSQLAIYEDFSAFVHTHKNKETELIEETFTIYDETGEKGNFLFDNISISEIYFDSWSNTFRVYFHEGYEVVYIEYHDVDLDIEDLEVQA